MFPYQKIHAKKPLFGKKAKLLNLGHLYFDIVSTVRCPVEDLGLRNSDFAALGISTTVVRALQIHPFLQNKANFRKVKLNVKRYNKADYVKRTLGQSGKNKANSKPIKANSNPISAKNMPKQTQTKPMSKGGNTH